MPKLADLPDVVVLARVIESGSFARAAAGLGVPPSTLSRRVAALEARLGVRTIERTTRQLRPTEIGLVLAERGKRIRDELADLESVVADHQKAPRGLLRLTAPTPIVDDFLGPALASYLERYPEMRVEVLGENRMVDLLAENIDVAVRLGKPRDSSLGTTRIALVGPVLAASQRYLDRAPPLRHPRDLADHAVIVFGRATKSTWRFVKGDQTCAVEIAPRAGGNSAPFCAQLAAAGSGITSIPRTVATAAGLAILEPGGWRTPRGDFCIVTPSARPTAPKVRAFIDVMRAVVARRPDMFDEVVTGR
jgi:DNA-binding transcriptional LysR family regulator